LPFRRFVNPSMPDSSPITIRPLASLAEYRAAVDLQYLVWGAGLTDVTAATILKIGQRIGGVSAGAFDADGTLIGFVFGLTGVEHGRIVHWSHMLAVRAEAQNRGIGRRLKEFQYAEVARVGAALIYWTYDPLVARNAHLNFNVLGVRAAEYVRDMYGDMGSTLTAGIGTDRFVVAWPVDPSELATRRAEIAAAAADPAFAAAPVINASLGGELHRAPVAAGAPRVRVRVPADIGSLQSSDPAAAAQWRADTRAAIEFVLAAGYHAAGFVADAARGAAHYLFAV
jgi:predicted GNAT superfamily acetyltransferase